MAGMEGASARREPEFGVVIALCCCQLWFTKEPLMFPLLSQSCTWDCPSFLGDSGTAARGISLQVPTQAKENL